VQVLGLFTLSVFNPFLPEPILLSAGGRSALPLSASRCVRVETIFGIAALDTWRPAQCYLMFTATEEGALSVTSDWRIPVKKKKT